MTARPAAPAKVPSPINKDMTLNTMEQIVSDSNQLSDMEALILEYVGNDVIETIGEETLRTQLSKGSADMDFDEIDFYIDQAIEDHNGMGDPDIKIQDVESFKTSIYAFIFGYSNFKQGHVIIQKATSLDADETYFFNADKEVFESNNLIISKVIGNFVKVKNRTNNKVTSNYYLSRWFELAGGNKMPINSLEIERLKSKPHKFDNKYTEMFNIKNNENNPDGMVPGVYVTHRQTNSQYMISNVNREEKTIMLTGTEHQGNWHPMSEFALAKTRNSCWTKDYEDVSAGMKLEAVVLHTDAIMHGFGWPNSKADLDGTYYLWRRAMIETEFVVVAIGHHSTVYMQAIRGPLFELNGADFVYKSVGDFFVKNRSAYYKSEAALNSCQNRSSAIDGNTIGFKTTRERELEEEKERFTKEEESDKAGGPYDLNHFVDKLVRLDWEGWARNGEPALVEKVDNVLGRIHIKFNGDTATEKYFIRKSLNQDKNLIILGDIIQTDEV